MNVIKDSTLVHKLNALGHWILPPAQDEAHKRFRIISLSIIEAVLLIALVVILLWPQ